MREKKDVLSVEEAKQQLLNSLKETQPRQFLTDNLWQAALVAFVVGMLSADSVKTRERLVGLGISLVRKFSGRFF